MTDAIEAAAAVQAAGLDPAIWQPYLEELTKGARSVRGMASGFTPPRDETTPMAVDCRFAVAPGAVGDRA